VVSASRRVKPDDVPDQIERLHQHAPLTDVHVHPSLKAYLFERNLWRHFWSGKAWDLSRKVAWASSGRRTTCKRELFSDCRLIRYAASLFVPDFRRLLEGSLFERTLEMMGALEREIGRRPDRVELARSAADVITGGSPPFTDFGRALLARLKALPMLVDVTHCTPEARAAVYAELGGERPIMASHVGVARHNRNPYNLGDEEIREIARSGGAVGVIFMTYWLDSSHPKDGLASSWRTIEHVHDVTGSWDHIVLGSDFDGFTDPPDDLRDSSSMGRVTGMLLERGVPEDDVMKILGGNAQRVLQAGWR